MTDTATAPPPASPPACADLSARCADVVHAVLMGEHGHRVRSLAQPVVAGRWSDDQLDDPPAVLADIVHAVNAHLHEVHVGVVTHRLLLALVVPDADPDADPLAAADAAVTRTTE